VKPLVLVFSLVASVSLLASERGPWRTIGKGIAGALTGGGGGPSGIPILPTDNAQAIVNANPAGSTFVIKNGYHRMQTITPHSGDTFIGESRSGAILSGARDLSPGVVTWTNIPNCHGGVQCWYVDGQTQQGSLVSVGSGCSGSATIEGTSWYPTCFYPEDVYFDNAFKYHCQVFANCPAGGWYLDYNGGGASPLVSKPADRLYVFDNPAGHFVEASVTRLAFSFGGINVTIKDLIFEKFANQYAEASITIENGTVLDNVEGRYNHYAATAVGGGGTIRNSHLHHNLCTGDRGGGNGQFINNETNHNNYFREYDEFWGCGGLKWNVAQGGGNILNSYSHDNIGPGFWCDTSCDGVKYDGNTIEDNSRAGIFWEISYGATITNNVLRRNGKGKDGVYYDPCGGGCPTAYPTESGVGISSSDGVTVAFNTFTDNYGSVQGVQDDRCIYDNQPGQSPGRFWRMQNLNVHDNTIISTTNLNGGVPPSNGIIRSGDGACPDPWAAAANNKWTHNTYTLGTFTNRFFVWNGGVFNRLTTAEWQSIPQDATGVFH